MQAFSRYPLTYGIIVLNLFFYFISIVLSGDIVDIDLQTLVNMGALYGPLVVLKGEWWRLLGAMFLHGGMTHILMNMFSLYLIGRGMELYFSRTAYITIYLFSGLSGGIASLYMHPESVGIGASGAIFGVFGALGGFFLAHKERIATERGKEILKDFAVIIGLNLFLGLSIASIDMSAHVGGLLTGFIGGFLIARSKKAVVPFGVVMAVLIWYALAYTLPEHYAYLFH